MKVLTLINNSNAGSSGGSGSEFLGQLLVITSAAGALPYNLPANIKVISVVAKTPAGKGDVSMSIVGHADTSLLFGPVDFAGNEVKTFSPNVALIAASQIFTINTSLVAPSVFEILITYIKIPGTF